MKDDKMTILTQRKLDKAQDTLERLIELTEDARVECCNADLTEQRDRLDRVGAYLRMARAEAGPLTLPGGVTTRSGGEK